MGVKDISGFFGIALALSCIAPVSAEEASERNSEQSSPRQIAANSGKQQTSSNSNPVERVGKAIIKLPIAATSFVVASVVGTPIAMVRQTASEVSSVSKQSYEGMHSPFEAPLVLVLGGPAIVTSALGGFFCTGPVSGVQNSLSNSMKKPFSKDAFSLGPMDEWNQN